MVNWTDVITMARTVWGEARGEGHAGEVAVAHVILNRFNSKEWFAGKTLAETCTKPYQFSCWNTSDPQHQAVARAESDTPGMADCLQAVMEAIQNPAGDPTMGATHYRADYIDPPAWAKPPAVETVKIGRHIFYKGVD